MDGITSQEDLLTNHSFASDQGTVSLQRRANFSLSPVPSMWNLLTAHSELAGPITGRWSGSQKTLSGTHWDTTP
jgi:hypothetical protein